MQAVLVFSVHPYCLIEQQAFKKEKKSIYLGAVNQEGSGTNLVISLPEFLG